MNKRTPRRILPIAAILMFGTFCISAAHASYGDTSTYLGVPYDGDGGPATNALLDFADDVASDTSGNLYIADTFNHAIRKVDPNGSISTLAGGTYGFTDGTGAAAEFANPKGVAADADGNVYVADTGNDAIRKISSSGTVTTLFSSGLSGPTAVAVAGTTLFISDTGNNAIKTASTFSGTSATLTTSVDDPLKMAVTADGSTLYVADNGNHRVIAVTTATGAVTVVAGSGTYGYLEGIGAAAQFQNVWGVTLDAAANRLFIAELDLYLTDRIRTIDLATGATTLFAIDTAQQEMIAPSGMSLFNGNLYVAMSGLGIIRRYAMDDASDTAITAGTDRFGSREGANPLFGRPNDLFLTNDQRYIYVADNNRIRRVLLATNTTEYIIGSVVDNYRDGWPVGSGSSNLDEARFSNVAGVVATSGGNTLFVADRWNNRIRKVDLTATPYQTSLVSGAGRYNGSGETTNGYQEGDRCSSGVDRNETLSLEQGCAYFLQPTSLVLDQTEHYLYVADTGNNRIRKVRISDGMTTFVAGGEEGFADGSGAGAKFHTPWGLALSDDGNTLYVADRDNHRIRAIDLTTNVVRTIAGSGSAGYREGIGTAAYFSFPRSLKLGADGKLYITESGSQRIRQVDPATGLTKLVAGSGNRGYTNGTATSVKFNTITGIAPETGGGVLYAADSSNDVLRKVDIQGTAPYTNPAPTISSIAPDEVDKDWDKGSGLRIKILGTGFRYGAVAKFYTYRAIKTYVVSTKEIVAELPLSKMNAGWYDVTVTNVDGQRDVYSAGIAVRAEDDSVPEIFYAVGVTRGIVAFPSTLRAGFFSAAGNVWGDERDELIAGAGNGLGPQVRIFSNTGVLRGQFYAYNKKLRTGVRVAACDLNNDGLDEIITAPGPGTPALVKAFTRMGKEILEVRAYPFGRRYTKGINVACADVTGNGIPEIVASMSKGGGPTVALLRTDGKTIRQFRVLAKSFRGGVTLGIMDLNGDGKREIVTAPESGGDQIKIWNERGRQLTPTFSPFARSYQDGLSITGGDTNNDGRDELIVAPRSNAQVRVRVFSIRPKRQRIGDFLAFPRGFTGGGNVSVGDVNGDGTSDIIVSPASNYAPIYRVYGQDGKPVQ